MSILDITGTGTTLSIGSPKIFGSLIKEIHRFTDDKDAIACEAREHTKAVLDISGQPAVYIDRQLSSLDISVYNSSDEYMTFRALHEAWASGNIDPNITMTFTLITGWRWVISQVICIADNPMISVGAGSDARQHTVTFKHQYASYPTLIRPVDR
jgi:hypothetical protein